MQELRLDPMVIARRMKTARKNRGWSQEVLAEKVDCSVGNISKYETSGLSDITWIERLSNALEQNLLVETIDVDKPIMELGKEILGQLISSNGKESVSYIVNHSMYGLSTEQVENEILKLAQGGYVVREQYKDWYNKKCDTVFISAKGLIAYKNLDLNNAQASIFNEKIKSVKTFEMRVGEYDSYQDYINANEGEKLIRSLVRNIGSPGVDVLESMYRMNFIEYLKENYIKDDDEVWSPEYKWLTGVNCYHDILYRMAYGLTNDVLIDEIDWDTASNEDMGALLEYVDFIDNEERVAIKAFAKELYGEDKKWLDKYYAEYSPTKFDNMFTEQFEKIFDNIYHSGDDEQRQQMDRFLEETAVTKAEFMKIYFWTQKDKLDENLKSALDAAETVAYAAEVEKRFELKKPEKAEGDLPINWFSADEIKTFINENYHEAQTEYEKEIDNKLKRIIRLEPECLNYYSFPKEWEENGLAELVRSKVGLPKTKKELIEKQRKLCNTRRK